MALLSFEEEGHRVKKSTKEKSLRISKQFLLYFFWTAGAICVAWPTIWMFLCMFKTTEEIMAVPLTFFPRTLNVENFQELFSICPYFRSYLNSVIVTGLRTSLVLFIASLLGYIFAKFEFPGRNIIFLLILATLMVPIQMKIIPLYLMVKKLGWLNTYQGIVAPDVISAFGIFLVRQYVQGLPDDYIEAARIDGLSEFGIYFKIALPLMKPVLSVLAIIIFLQTWGALLWPLIVINSTEMRTIPLLLSALSAVDTASRCDYGVLLTAAGLASFPMLVVFFVFQKQFIKSAFLSGIK